MPRRLFRRSLACLTAASAAFAFTAVSVAADSNQDEFNESNVHPTSAKFGGAAPLENADTVMHWSDETRNPVDKVRYRYNMVGVDPRTEGSATVGVDVIPVNLNLGGHIVDASAAVDAVLASPIFQDASYENTSAATNAGGGKGAGGEVSAGNFDAQLLDATMRAEFDKVGTGYHLFLAPTRLTAITINVPVGLGVKTPTFIAVENDWFKSTVQAAVHTLHLDPSRLALFLTDNVVLFFNTTPKKCCVIGAHGADDLPAATSDDGHQQVNTFVWSSWLAAGINSHFWAISDIHGLSHEIVEWANNPFLNNTVQPWPSAPGAPCNNDLLETGDPLVGFGFEVTINQHTYYPQDEVFLPWFMRLSHNKVSQPMQSDRKDGRYTFLGDLTPNSFFQQPPAC